MPCTEEAAYLLLPWGDEYCRAVEKIIEGRFAEWQKLCGKENAVQPFIDESNFKELLPDWQGARHCRISKRIIKDGCAVGFCCREEPDSDDTGWDSGWYFEAGDEDEVYAGEDAEYGIYDLNTICNLYPELLPLLNSPYGTAFERNKSGMLVQIKDEEE